jgi:hypothetical protein
MNAATRSQGVSGSASALPDQGALRLAPIGDKTGEQSCDDNEGKARQLRFYLPPRQFRRWKDLPPSKRSRAVAAVLGAVEADIDLHRLIDAAADLRRVGVLLNQCMPEVHQGRAPLDFLARVEAVVNAIEELRA